MPSFEIPEGRTNPKYLYPWNYVEYTYKAGRQRSDCGVMEMKNPYASNITLSEKFTNQCSELV